MNKVLYFFLIATLGLFGGCVSVGGPVATRSASVTMDSNASLGLAPSLSEDPTEYGFTEAGLARSARRSYVSLKVVTEGASLIFPDRATSIVWYGLIDTQKHFMQMVMPNYYIQWFKPDGTLAYDKTLKPYESPGLGFYKCKLNLESFDKEARIGRWRVRVFRKDRLVDDRYFKIVRT